MLLGTLKTLFLYLLVAKIQFSLTCCSFGFYIIDVSFHLSLQHSYRDGSVEEVVLRHLGAADGETVIAKNIR